MTADDLAKRQDLHGQEYADLYETGQHPLRIGRLIERLALPPRAHVLDVGCGNALILDELAPRSAQIEAYVGVDFSAELLKYAEQRRQRLGFEQARFHHGSLESALEELSADWADVALAFDVSEHVPDDEWLSACAAVRTLVKPGGRFLLHTPNREFFLERMKAHNFVVKQFDQHIAVRTPEHNVRLLREAGFSDVSVDYLPHYNALRRLHPLSRLPLVGPSFRARLFITAR